MKAVRKQFYKLVVLLVVVGMGALNCSAQNDVTHVTFKFWRSLRISDYHIEVSLLKIRDSISATVIREPMPNHDRKGIQPASKEVFTITEEEFNQAVLAVSKIKSSSVSNEFGYSGYDGTTCSLEFGTYASSITYKVWSPDMETGKRNLKPFLDACNLIIRTGKLKPSSVF